MNRPDSVSDKEIFLTATERYARELSYHTVRFPAVANKSVGLLLIENSLFNGEVERFCSALRSLLETSCSVAFGKDSTAESSVFQEASALLRAIADMNGSGLPFALILLDITDREKSAGAGTSHPELSRQTMKKHFGSQKRWGVLDNLYWILLPTTTVTKAYKHAEALGKALATYHEGRGRPFPKIGIGICRSLECLQSPQTLVDATAEALRLAGEQNTINHVIVPPIESSYHVTVEEKNELFQFFAA